MYNVSISYPYPINLCVPCSLWRDNRGGAREISITKLSILYDNNMACDWTISMPHGRTILSFYDMSIQWGGDDCRHDSVIVSAPRGQGQATGKTGTYKGVPLK